MTSTAATVSLLIVLAFFTALSIGYQYIVFKALDERLRALRKVRKFRVIEGQRSPIFKP